MRALDYGLVAAVIGMGLIFLGHLVELMMR